MSKWHFTVEGIVDWPDVQLEGFVEVLSDLPSDASCAGDSERIDTSADILSSAQITADARREYDDDVTLKGATSVSFITQER